MQITERTGSSDDYRYGFNGKEKDDEVMGEGNFEDYGMRMYNPRLGRFFNVDPLTESYPELTPYQFANNTPIWAIDLDGLEAFYSNEGVFQKWGKDKSPLAAVIIDGEHTLDLNITEFLNRANWVYGEGGGKFSDRYAMTIENLKKSGRSGYGPKPFTSEEAMYKATMLHGTPAKCLYPSYFDGTYKGANARSFALARKNIESINDKPKMVASIKSVIGSQLGTIIDEGYNNWRGSGDKLYTEQEKSNLEKKGTTTSSVDVTMEHRGKVTVIGKIITKTTNYWELVGDKYRRHTFKEITYEKVPKKK